MDLLFGRPEKQPPQTATNYKYVTGVKIHWGENSVGSSADGVCNRVTQL